MLTREASEDRRRRRGSALEQQATNVGAQAPFRLSGETPDTPFRHSTKEDSMENRKRPVKLNVRFTEEEYAALKEKAEEAGISMNDFIRKLVAGKEFNTCPPQEANKLLWELYAVGSDVRRFLAKVDEVRLADASQMRKVLAHVYLAVDKIVKFYHIEGEK